MLEMCISTVGKVVCVHPLQRGCPFLSVSSIRSRVHTRISIRIGFASRGRFESALKSMQLEASSNPRCERGYRYCCTYAGNVALKEQLSSTQRLKSVLIRIRDVRGRLQLYTTQHHKTGCAPTRCDYIYSQQSEQVSDKCHSHILDL